MKVLKVLWVGLVTPVLPLLLIWYLGFWWVWASGFLVGFSLGAALSLTFAKEFMGALKK